MAGEFGSPSGVLDAEAGLEQHETVQPAGADGQQDAEQREGTPEQWYDAYANRSSWEKSLKQKDQRYAHVRRILETAFNRSMDQWNQVDMSDLQAFAMINARVRTDPAFAQKWHSALKATFEESGASPAQAEAKATAVTQAMTGAASPAQAPAPQAPAIPPEYAQRLTRMEQIAVQQEFNALESNLWDQLDASVAEIAPELADDYGDILAQAALQGLFFHSDAELIARAHDGTLPELVNQYMQRAVDALRGANKASDERRASASAERRQIAPTPFGGGTAPAASPDVEKLTVKQMGERLRKAMAAMEE